MEALLKNKLISPDKLNLMFTSYKNNYGYGWYTYDGFIEHHGITFGFSSYIINRFTDNLKVIILSNIQLSDLKPIAKSIKKYLFEI